MWCIYCLFLCISRPPDERRGQKTRGLTPAKGGGLESATQPVNPHGWLYPIGLVYLTCVCTTPLRTIVDIVQTERMHNQYLESRGNDGLLRRGAAAAQRQQQ